MQTEQVTRIVLWLAGAVVAVNIALALFVVVRRILHARYFHLKDEAHRHFEPIIQKIGQNEFPPDVSLFDSATSVPQRDALEDLLLAQLDGPQRPLFTTLAQQLGYVNRWAETAFGRRNAQRLLAAAVDPPGATIAALDSIFIPRRKSLRIYAVARSAAVKKLGSLASDSAISWLRAALRDPSPLVVRTAITALGRIESRDAVPLLLEQLTAAVDGDSGISIRSIKGALVRHPVASTAHFVPLLTYSNARLRFLAVDTIREMCTTEARVSHGSSQLPLEVLSALIDKCAQDVSADVRARTAAVVSFARDSQASATLTRLMRDQNQFVRLHAVRACANPFYEALLPNVAERVTDSFWRVREAAVRTMFAFGRRGLDTLLNIFLNTEDTFAREQIVEELQRNGTLLQMIRGILNPSEHERNIQVLKRLVAMQKTAIIRMAAQSTAHPAVRSMLQELLSTAKETAPASTTHTRAIAANTGAQSDD